MLKRLAPVRDIGIPALLLLILAPGCAPRSASNATHAASVSARSDASLAFTDVTREAGIRFQHNNGAVGKFYYPQTFGSGCAFIDYDRDGLLDIVLVNSGDFGSPKSIINTQHSNLVLYHNNRNGTFTDVTEQAGLNVSLYGMGVAVGDYENDGYDDLYITGLDHSLLFRNEGNGRFRDVTRDSGVGNQGHWGTSAAWLDYDNDGRLDLFVCCYVRWQPDQEQVCRQGDLRIYCGPLIYQADSCRLFRNLGGGRFRDVTRDAGIYKTTGKALGVAVWDVDGDRYPDILVANDLTPNYLFRNNRNGTFSEVGLESGIAYGADGMARSGMGIDFADTNNDGKCQALVSNFAREPNSFFTQEGLFVFTDKTYEAGMGEPSLQPLGFGLFLFDYDNDGWKDAFITNGHIQPEIARYEPGQSFAQEPLLFHNRRDGTFEEVHKQLGAALASASVGRGAACGDYDNDGNLDILLTSNNGPARLLRNDGGNRNSWLTIRLVGRKSNRDGIGAEVRIRAGGRTLRDQVRSGSSYLSASDLRLHFGLGEAAQADWVEVRWPTGVVDRLQAVKANRLLTIEEGQSVHRGERTGGSMKRAGGVTIGFLASLILLFAVTARGQDGPAERHQRVLQYLKRAAAEISDRSLADIDSLENWQRRRTEIRRQLLSMLGLEPFPKRSPLKAAITGALSRPNYRIEKIVFQSLPGLYVTGNLYVPHSRSGPLPAVLYACGHSPHPLGAKWDYQDRAAWFADHGYVCLILDTLEFGEVPGIHHGIHDLNMWNWLSIGYTPIGVEVWNAIRALDYLETRAEVDRRHIGMTGISGGGAATWYTAAVDERIAAAVPVCSTFTFGSQADHWVASGQCDCIYYHNTYLTDFPVVGALIAPRPLMICSGRKDIDFPPDGYHEVYRRVRRIYALYGRSEAAPERIEEVDDDVGHTDAPLFLNQARHWMNRWLKGSADPVASTSTAVFQAERAEDLACLSALPVDAINYRIHDLFIPMAARKTPTTLPEWEQRRHKIVRALKQEVFRWFPTAKIPFETRAGGGDGGWAARYAEYKDVVFDSEAGVPVRAQLLRPRDHSAATPLLIYVKRPGDSIYFLDMDELLPLLGRYTVLILNPRLTEHPVSGFEFAEIERSASWAGRTVASMQVWDILRAVDWITREEGLNPTAISLYGKGDMGVLALYAGLFDSRIQQIVLKDPPVSHQNGPALLNVLRITDIPEVAGAFAPRRLVFLRAIPPGLEATRRLFKLSGSLDHLTSAGSLPEALEVWKHSGSPALTRTAPRETDELLSNPGMGWQTFHTFADEDKNLRGLPSASAYFRFYWREIEPKEGAIDFAKFDALLAHAQRDGQKLAFRIMCTGSGSYMDVPGYLKEQGCRGTEFLYGGSKHWVPDFEDPQFQKSHFQLIRELGRRYDGHPDMDLLDIGSVGLWGEWHMSDTKATDTGAAVPLPSVEMRRKIIDAWRSAFPKSSKVVLIGSDEGMERAEKSACGWRADCLGDMGGFSKTWNHMDNYYLQQLEKTGANEAWRTGPVAFESCWDMRKWKESGWDIRYIYDYALRCHATYMNNKSAPIPAGTRAEVERFLRRLGYRLVVRSVEHTKSAVPGDELAVSIVWENAGVAPPYRDYRVSIRLAGASDRPAKPIIVTTETSIRGWLPGSHTTKAAVRVPRTVRPGRYELSVGLVDPVTKTPAVRLAIEGRDAGGWYPVSHLDIGR